MPVRSRSGFVLSFACVGALVACSSGAPAPQRCATSADCSATARCIASTCVANAPPVPSIALPPTLETFALLTFDGSASADPDAGDSVVSHAWTFRAVDAPCEPPVVADTGPLARVRFGCPGRYAVELAVTDGMTATATKATEFDVARSEAASAVTVSADQGLDHVCTSMPTHCAPDGAVTLSAGAPGFEPDAITFEWQVEAPPDRPLNGNRRVTFSPGPLVASPTVAIETDGQAISGDWIFHVRARDAAGVIGAATTRVSVKNRLPVLLKTIPTVEHAFAAGEFTATGAVPFTVSDPDGDSLVGPIVSFHHAGDGGARFTGEVLASPPRIAFEIVVPFAAPDDALRLIGGEGLERTIAVAVTDANDATTAQTWPIVVHNRRPSRVSSPAPFTIDHTFDPTALAYSASVPLATWTDPDGDPLVQVAGSETTDPLCASFAIGADGIATVECTLPFTGAAALANLTGVHSVVQRVQDPWEEAVNSATTQFTIADRAPVITSTANVSVLGECADAGCCGVPPPGEPCEGKVSVFVASSTMASRWSDPDGDPLDVTFAGTRTVCVEPGCELTLTDLRMATCGPLVATKTLTVTDGVTPVSADLDVIYSCQ